MVILCVWIGGVDQGVDQNLSYYSSVSAFIKMVVLNNTMKVHVSQGLTSVTPNAMSSCVPLH